MQTQTDRKPVPDGHVSCFMGCEATLSVQGFVFSWIYNSVSTLSRLCHRCGSVVCSTKETQDCWFNWLPPFKAASSDDEPCCFSAKKKPLSESIGTRDEWQARWTAPGIFPLTDTRTAGLFERKQTGVYCIKLRTSPSGSLATLTTTVQGEIEVILELSPLWYHQRIHGDSH